MTFTHRIASNGTTMFALIFADDEERIRVGKQILDMEPKAGNRWWVSVHDTVPDAEVAAFMGLTPEEIEAKRKALVKL